MSQSRSPLPRTASPPRAGVGPARPDARVARSSRPRSARRPPAPRRLPTPSSPAASSPVTAGAAGSRAEADAGDPGYSPGRGGHVWASGGVQAEAGGSPGPAPASRRLWGV